MLFDVLRHQKVQQRPEQVEGKLEQLNIALGYMLTSISQTNTFSCRSL